MVGTDPEIDGAGGDEAMAGRVDDGEFAGRESECDGLGGASREMDALETDESTQRGTFDTWTGEVEFDDLVAGEGGFVGDEGGNGDGGIAVKCVF